MTTSLRPSRSRRSIVRSWWPIAAVSLLFVLAGCMNDAAVKSLVRDSNYQMLLASVPGLETGGIGTNPDPTKDQNQAIDDAAARIEAFVAQNPDDPALVSALRLRQGLLYLNHRSFALADGAFKDVKPDALHSVRDKALYSTRATLQWWTQFALEKPASFYATQKDAANKAMLTLAQTAQSKDLISAPDLADYFLEMRAWIGLKLGLAMADATESRATLQDAVNVYAATFSSAELKLLGSGDFKAGSAFDAATRRVLRARSMLTTLAEATRGSPSSTLTLSPPEFQQYYAALPH